MLKKWVAVLAGWAVGMGATSAQEIKVGVVVALSGAVAIYGEPVPKTLRLLVDQLPDQKIAGHPVKLVVVDSESNSTKAVQLVRRLIDRDEVDVIIGPSTSGEAIPIVPVVNQAKVPNITFGSAEPVTTPVTPYVFGVAPYDRLGIINILESLQKKGQTRIALIHSQDGFGQGGMNIFKETAAKYGVELSVVESFAPQDTDMTPQLLRVREASNIGAVVVWAPTPGPTILLRNAAALKMPMPFYLGFAQASNAFLEQVGSAGEGAYVSALPIIAPDVMSADDTRRSQMLSLSKQYKDKYNAVADQTVGHALDAFLIVKGAVESIQGPMTRITLRDAIEKFKFCGANGCRAYKPDDHRGLEKSGLIMLQIKDGRWRAAS
jgi:branched-chain amino acid transport system substrate-binding protein